MTHPAVPIIEYLIQDLLKLCAISGTEEVVVNKPNEAFTYRNGKWERHEVAIDYNTLYDLAILCGSLRHQDVGPDEPLLGGELPTGERYQFVVPPCSMNETVSLTMRKPGDNVIPIEDMTKKYVTDNWNKWEKRKEMADRRAQKILSLYYSGNMIEFFLACIAERLNIFMIGATGAGKTTALNTFTSNISMDERLITVEDASEIVITQPNHVRLFHSASYVPGAGVDPAKLLKAALRMRPTRIILQELRDSLAAWVYVNTVGTGHPGSITTIHGATPEQAMTRLYNLCKGDDTGKTFDGPRLASLIACAVDVFIPFSKTTDNKFQINEVWFSADAATRGETAADLLNTKDIGANKPIDVNIIPRRIKLNN